MADEQFDNEIWVGSIVSHRTQEGIVQLTWGDKVAQLSVADARKIAFDILECAESAQTDEIIIGFGKEMNDLEAGVALMQFFRHARDERLKERGKR